MSKLHAAAIFLLILVAWAASPYLIAAVFPDLEHRGQFGDSFGALNSLFSGFAFAGVVLAILLQRIELRLQREELSLTRTELSRAAKAQEQSGTYLGEQSEVMKVAAHINGLAAIIQARTQQIEYLKTANQLGEVLNLQQIKDMSQDRMRNIEELESLMHGVLCAADYEKSQ